MWQKGLKCSKNGISKVVFQSSSKHLILSVHELPPHFGLDSIGVLIAILKNEVKLAVLKPTRW